MPTKRQKKKRIAKVQAFWNDWHRAYNYHLSQNLFQPLCLSSPQMPAPSKTEVSISSLP